MRTVRSLAMATAVTLGGASALVVALPTAASAAVCSTSWSSAVSGSWTDASKWSAGVPGGASDACITVNGTYTVTLNGGGSANSLKVGGRPSASKAPPGSGTPR